MSALWLFLVDITITTVTHTSQCHFFNGNVMTNKKPLFSCYGFYVVHVFIVRAHSAHYDERGIRKNILSYIKGGVVQAGQSHSLH